MTQRTKPTFSITSEIAGRYSHLNVRIYIRGNDLTYDPKVLIRYQSDTDNPIWYSGDFSIEARSIEDLMQTTKVLKRILGDPFSPNGSAVALLQKLSALDQVVYDCRVSELVPINEVKPSSYAAYRDDWSKLSYGLSGCTVGCLAETDDEARRLLTAQFCEHKGEYYQSRFDIWLAAGRPVTRLSHGWHAPEILKAQDEIARLEALAQKKAA